MAVLNTDEEGLLEQAKEWFGGEVDRSMRDALKKTMSKIEAITPFEDKLVSWGM